MYAAIVLLLLAIVLVLLDTDKKALASGRHRGQVAQAQAGSATQLVQLVRCCVEVSKWSLYFG